ncbi:MAG: hypothetical protein DBX47_06450 [Clostridiales bacterium]|nr:MAG: hypothetical protein DBX47_06450 [Clostridiales bacterium]
MYKKFLGLLMIILMLFTLCCCVVVQQNETSVPLYNATQTSSSTITVTKDQTIFVRFNATAFFNGVNLSFDTNINANVVLKRWEGSLSLSREGEAIADSEIFFAGGQETMFSFPAVERGEYILCVNADRDYNLRCQRGAWNYSSIYVNALKSRNLHPYFSLNYMYSKDVLLSELTTDNDIYYYAEYDEVLPSENDAYVARDVYADTYACTDGLGRTLPLNSKTGDVKEDKFGGIFFWTWHSEKYAYSTTPGNNAEILEYINQNGMNVSDYPWASSGKILHYWDKPIWDYYKSTDEWVLVRQAQLLADAGVDVLFFDSTNNVELWKDEYFSLCRAFERAKAGGINVPKIAFMLPFGGSNAGDSLTKLYYDIYEPGAYNDLWFYWEGKPLVLCAQGFLDATKDENKPISDFFTFRACNGSYSGIPSNGMWNWLSKYPQMDGLNPDGKFEQLSVSVAQNCRYDSSSVACMSDMDGIQNRAYTVANGFSKNEERDMLYGLNFAEQWEYAIEKDPEFIFVTGWNEWHAINQSGKFVDQFSPLYSRDCEPSTGVLKDHYYYQLASYIRTFKGTRKARPATEAKTIDIYADVNQWDNVGPNFYAYADDVFDRDQSIYPSYFSNNTGRNDIVLAKVSHDRENLYFYVETANKLTPFTDNSWMNLYIDIGNSSENWEGFEYVINRSAVSESQTKLEKSSGGWNWSSICDVDYNVTDNVLQVVIPLAALGITADTYTVNFKWADNTECNGDIMDFYTYGDVAPEGRFMYNYIVK